MFTFLFVGIGQTFDSRLRFPKVGIRFPVMGNNEAVRTAIIKLMEEQDRSAAWVSRTSRVPYKRILSEIWHAKQPLKLETAIAACIALGTTLADILASITPVHELAATG